MENAGVNVPVNEWDPAYLTIGPGLKERSPCPWSYLPSWHGIGCNLRCFSSSAVNFFQRYRGRRAEHIEPPAVEPPPLPKEEPARPTDPVTPIHVDDAQYALLTRALRPGSVCVQNDVPGSNAAAVMDEAASPPIPPERRADSSEPPPGAPIV